jgi:hypothetical protein
MIYKLSDGTRVRTTRDGNRVHFETYRFTPEKEVIGTEWLIGDEAYKRIHALTVGDGIRFVAQFGAHPKWSFAVGDSVHVYSDVTAYRWDAVGHITAVFPGSTHPYGVDVGGCYARFAAGEVTERLAHTGRPSRTPFRAAAVTAGAATVLALAAVLAQPHSVGEDMAPAPYFSRTSEGIEPYYPTPEPRTSTNTSRHGERKALTVEHIATPSTTPTKRHPIAKPPADIRISFYRDCTGHAQECIDAGALTMYAGRILAGHAYMGYSWLARVPVGQEVRVISGPLAGTYEVYGHLRINRQGGSIPAFPGSPALVLQTCVGDGTGFSLLKRAA